MQRSGSSERQILDEDLQIIRATLATITKDVRQFSVYAANAIPEALEKLDRAQWEFYRASANAIDWNPRQRAGAATNYGPPVGLTRRTPVSATSRQWRAGAVAGWPGPAI
jgi:hypothetical protein